MTPSHEGSPIKGQKKAHKLFQHKLFGPHPKPRFWAPRRKSLCASISWERTQKRHRNINFFAGILGSKTGFQTGHFGPQRVHCLLFFLPLPMLHPSVSHPNHSGTPGPSSRKLTSARPDASPKPSMGLQEALNCNGRALDRVTKESTDQIGKNCPKNVRKLCFQPLRTIFGHFSDIFSTLL